MHPLVSILIPCFNAAPWVHRAIETALAQTWPSKEVIVLDDGSTDGSLDVIKRFIPHVFVETQSNSGQNAARNRLTELSHGEWLVYLDADDELAPDSVEKKFSQATNADAIYGTIEVASFAGSEKTRSTIYPALEFEDPIIAAFGWGFPNTSAFLFRKSAIEEAGGWNPHIKNCTDYDMYFKLLLKEKKFRAAPLSNSMYRQWSLTQAVYENSLRRSRTRLQLMWQGAKELEARGDLTVERKEAFEQAAFGILRSISEIDPSEASKHHAQLAAWSAKLRPKASLSYQLTYRLVGFELAERLAKAAREFNLTKKPPLGTDPQSGMPYV